MSVVTDELKSDAEFLREQASSLKARREGDEGTKIEIEDIERLRRIADDQETYASLMHSTSLLLEQRVEEQMDTYVRSALDRHSWGENEPQLLMLWLIVRALRSGASKSLLGQGLASIGAGALGSFIGDVMGGKGAAPLDPDDK